MGQPTRTLHEQNRTVVVGVIRAMSRDQVNAVDEINMAESSRLVDPPIPRKPPQPYTLDGDVAADDGPGETVKRPTMTQVQIAAQRARRFTAEPGADERREQLSRSAQILTQLALPTFAPVSEKEFEEWTDQLTTKVARRKICVALVFDAWRAACGERLPAGLADATMPETAEQLIEQVATAIFPSSTYHWALHKLVNARRNLLCWRHRTR